MQNFVTHPAKWLSRLVQIPSVNPLHSSGKTEIAGEGRIAAEIAQWFRDLGGETTVEIAAPERPNVYGIWRGSSNRWVAVDVHTDTVGVAQMPGNPFSGDIHDGKVWGRGAVDDKASLATILAVLEIMQAKHITPEANIVIGATVDEEEGGPGPRKFAAWLKQNGILADLVVAEPTGCAPCYGHKGAVRCTYTTHGVATHTSQPELGRNAISAMIPVIQALEAEHTRLCACPPSATGRATLTVSMIHGGRAFNIVPDACTISVDRRVVAGERATDVARQLEEIVRAASPAPVDIQQSLCENAFYQPADSEIVQQFSAWSGQSPITVPYGSNAFAYGGGVVKSCVVLGPGSIDQAHGAEEWVEIKQLETLAGIYARWWGVKSLESS